CSIRTLPSFSSVSHTPSGELAAWTGAAGGDGATGGTAATTGGGAGRGAGATWPRGRAGGGGRALRAEPRRQPEAARASGQGQHPAGSGARECWSRAALR